jgi:hypothetical protein
VIDTDDAAPQQLVHALGALLRSTASPIERQFVRAEARDAVMAFVRRRRSQGERADRVLAGVRQAWRNAQNLHMGTTMDRLAEPLRALREEVVRWAIRADAPDALPRRELPARHEAPAGL